MRFVRDCLYGRGQQAKELVFSGWRPTKSALDNLPRQVLYRDGSTYHDELKRIREYLYEISTRDAGSSPVTQDSQVLSVAQNEEDSRPFPFGEHGSSALTSVVGW